MRACLLKALLICLAVAALVYFFGGMGLNYLERSLVREESEATKALRVSLKEYSAQALTMPAEEAAAQWLQRFDAWTGSQMELPFATLVEALPPAQSWDALAAAIEQRPQEPALQEQCLGLLSAVLRGDSPGRSQAVARFRELVSKDPKLHTRSGRYYEEKVDQIGQDLETIAGSPKDQLAAFTATLEAHEKKAERAGSITIPDLLREADEASVAPLLVRALHLDETIQVHGLRTRRLAARLALESLQGLKKPVWDLVETKAELPLYEGLARRFPKDTTYDRHDADLVYLLHLIAADRTDEAATLMLKMIADQGGSPIGTREVEALHREGFSRQTQEFLRVMLSHDPSLPLWEVFIQLSAHEGKSKETLLMLRTTVARPGLGDAARREVESYLYRAHLAADEVDEGLKLLGAMIKNEPGKLSKSTAPNASSEMADRRDLARALLKLGLLLGKPALVEEAADAVLAAYARIAEGDSSSNGELHAVAQMLLQAGRASAAETLLRDALRHASEQKWGRHSPRETRKILVTLMWLFHQQGRSSDILQLLDSSPEWQAADLAALGKDSSGKSVLVMAAQALADTGKKSTAQLIAQRAVQHEPGNDSAYALLLSLEGDDLEALLDTLQAAHRFEERPLIWKAQLRLNEGRLEEAEKTIRAAIAIDPSDGEQGKGDRMRAYAVLADILDKKGDADQAKGMRGAVQAIRISENADDWWKAGLLSRAVAMYEEALTHFADAYCIQSRLALRYSELGDFAKAEMHYQRAFELMPDSFGRVESHCFGCEGAFSGSRAQNIADKVFTQLAVKLPEKAQVFYLLGYLRDQQKRPAEAAEFYRRAVKLDPDYLNAWRRLLGTAEQLPMARTEQEKIALAMFRLDPEASNEGLQSMSDLRALWDALLATEADRPPIETSSLYPLAASAKAIANDRQVRQEAEELAERDQEASGYRRHLGQNDLIQAVRQMFDMVGRSRR